VPTGPAPYLCPKIPRELIGRTEIVDNQIHLLGYAPKGSKARKTIEFDNRYPSDVFNGDEYIQMLVLPR